MPSAVGVGRIDVFAIAATHPAHADLHFFVG
jgi:hypothetical protein